jgi:hypothetical protein
MDTDIQPAAAAAAAAATRVYTSWVIVAAAVANGMDGNAPLKAAGRERDGEREREG